MRLTPRALGRRLAYHDWALAFPYVGSSMNGTFRHGDVLLVITTPLEGIRPGDVVAYRNPGARSNSSVVAHRVRRLTKAGFISQGDHNRTPDSQSIGAENLVGRVCSFQRDGKTRHVWGGRVGRLWAGYLRLRRRIVPLIGWPYRALRRSGIVRSLWRPRLEQVHLETADGPLVKYIHRQRVVARWWPGRGHFWCRKPYDLILPLPGGGIPGGEGVSKERDPQS